MRTLADRYVVADAEPRKGGMAEVCRAADSQDNLKPVAIKFMRASQIHNDRIVREAFSRELSALTALNHPNVVRMVDFDPRHDPPYMVLEWIDRDLNAFLESTTIADWSDFYARFGHPILDALSYALTKKLVHRDLKPSNILVDEHGAPKVSDFGISKFYSPAPGGFTLGSFKSEPYAPFAESSIFESRDPYSFAVIAVRCFAGKELVTHEDVANALDTFPGPKSIKDVLIRALDHDPSKRFPNIVALHEALEKESRAQDLGQTRPVCYIVISQQLLMRLGEQLGISDPARVSRVLEQDLAADCALFSWLDRDTGRKVDQHFLARTPQFGLRLAVRDNTRDHLIVQHVWTDESENNESRRQFGFHAAVTFRFGSPPPGRDGVPAMQWLSNAIEQHELDDAAARRARREEAVLREWASTLRFRQQLDERRHLPIQYSRFISEGNRLTFFTTSVPSDVVFDQPRMVRKEQRIILSGVVDDVGADQVKLWVERGIADLPPEKGQLLFDDRASRIAIERQKTALDAVRYGRCLRPTLRTFILDPQQSRPPSSSAGSPIKWTHSDLDDDKKSAVTTALAAEDVLVVQGPPGTGKTVFITELVSQLLDKDPNCKILLTSQTHVALDNVLEKCQSARPGTKLLRIAMRDDDRVSQGVQSLTIDRVADRWKAEVSDASEKFLSQTAVAMGVSRNDIALGVAVGRLRVESAELDRINGRLAETETFLAAAEQKLQEAQVGRVADHYPEVSEEVDELREQVEELRDTKKAVGARRRRVAKELASMGELGAQLADVGTKELIDWEKGLLEDRPADREFHDLLRLSEEWQLRFGRSREFYSAMIADSSVVAGTCLGFARVPGILSAEFDVCIVDEASKATPTELLVPMARARRWVLVGDPKQLPPFVEDLLDDRDLLKEHELDRQSFETTLLDRLVAGLPSGCIASLTTQHRMIRPIGDLISNCFYGGALHSVRDDRDETLRLAMPKPVTWLSTAQIDRHSETAFNGTVKNITEAKLIGTWLRRLDFYAKVSNKSYRVGVISGYVGQRTELQRVIASIQHTISCLSIECNTVDAFQGREVDVCVYSVTRCNDRGTIGFLRDERRMNVALSRGRSGLLIVGDHLFCRSAQDPNPLRTVVSYIESHAADCAIESAEASK